MTAELEPVGEARGPKQQRLLSLDVFRGLTIATMVLVNNPGSSEYFPPWLRHASWGGWAIPDLVFPFFLFIVGVAIPYSLESRLARGAGKSRILLGVLRRSVLLFVLGMVLNGFPKYELSHLRIMGVLQRIALCYFAASAIYLHTKPRTQVVIGAAILVLYFLLMKFVPVPGYGAGLMKTEGNWVQYIDSHLLAGHMQSRTFDGKSIDMRTFLWRGLSGWVGPAGSLLFAVAEVLFWLAIMSLLYRRKIFIKI